MYLHCIYAWPRLVVNIYAAFSSKKVQGAIPGFARRFGLGMKVTGHYSVSNWKKVGYAKSRPNVIQLVYPVCIRCVPGETR